MEDTITWSFPQDIKFEEVAEYLEKFKKIDSSRKVIFDLRDTLNVHSSFIGFLIHAKNIIESKNGSMVLDLSFTVRRILSLMNVMDYFHPEIASYFSKKTA
jgi:hypothetical protein